MADDTFDMSGDTNANFTILNQEDEVTPQDVTHDEDGTEDAPPVEEDETKPPVEEEEEVEEEEKAEKPPTTAESRRHPYRYVKDITAKYPNFFKEFPDIKDIMFMDQKFHEVFPTIDDAKVAADDAKSFTNLRDLVKSGSQKDFGEFLKGVDMEQGALKKMSYNFLPSLFQTNRDLYFQVTQPIAESLLRNAFKTGKGGNENLMNAALVLSEWAFGETGYATGEKATKLEVVEDKVDPNLQKERTEFFLQKYNDTRAFVTEESHRRLKAEIARGFDPNNAFPEFTRNLLISKAIEEIGLELEKDKRHMGTMNSMWKKADQSGFTSDWKDRLLNTYLSGARAVMPAVRTRIRNAAMKAESQTSETRERQGNKSGERKEVRGSATTTATKNGRTPSSGEVDWSKTTDIDFLNDKITYKKR